MRSMSVLIADSHPDCAESLALVLRILGYDVWIADDGPTALRKAEMQWPDAAIKSRRIGLEGE